MKSSNALQSLAIFAVLTAVFALGPILADLTTARAAQQGGSGTVHTVPTPGTPGPSAPTRAQLQTEINALTKTVNALKTAYGWRKTSGPSSC